MNARSRLGLGLMVTVLATWPAPPTATATTPPSVADRVLRTRAHRSPAFCGGADVSPAPRTSQPKHSDRSDWPARLLRLRVLDQSFGVARGDDFTVAFDLSGSSDDIDAARAAVMSAITPPPASSETSSVPGPATSADPNTVTVTAHDPMVSPDQLESLDQRVPDHSVDRVELTAADVLEFADGTAAGELSVPVGAGGPLDGAANGLDLDQPGIYPVTIDVYIAGEVIASALTFMELVDRDDANGAPLAVSILAGVDDPGPWPSPTELQSASLEVAKLVELGEAVDGPLSIALPPILVRLLTASPGSGQATAATSPPTSASEPVDEATTTGDTSSSPVATAPVFAGIESPEALRDAFRADELLGVPAVGLDPSSLVPIDQRDLFTGQLRAGEDILSTASPRAVVSRSVWLSDRPISGAAGGMLRDLGIRMVVVSDDVANSLGVTTDAPVPQPFAVGLANGASLSAMTFSHLGIQLQTPPGDQTVPTANDRAVRLLVELQLSRLAADVPAVVLAVPRTLVPDPAITAQFVALANDLADIAVVPISRLPGLVGGAAAPVPLPETVGADLTSRLAVVTAARADADHASSMLVESDRAAEWHAELDRVMSSEVDDTTAFGHLRQTTTEIDAVLGAIVAPDPFTFTLTGTSSTLRIRLQNTSTQPLDVMVVVRSSKLRFPDGAPIATVPGGETIEVPVAVEVRSNGTFTVEVDVLAPDAARLAPPVVLKARVTRVTGLSQVATGGALLVLVSWWYSHLRRNRRRRIARTIAASESSIPFNAVAPDAAETLIDPQASTDRRDTRNDGDRHEPDRTIDRRGEPR